MAVVLATFSITGWFYALAGVFLLYHMWRGWKLGVVRASLKLTAWVGSGLFGWYGGLLAAEVAGGIFPPARVFVGVLVGVTLGLGFYVILTVLAAFFFKKTGDNSSTLVRWTYGVGGAAVGCCLGLILLWGVVTAVRAWGGMQEARQAGEANRGGMAQLKESFEGEGLGGWVGKMDPIPSSMYESLAKFSRVSADPDALVRLAEYPDIADLLQHPKFLAFSQNPEIQQAAQSRNMVALMSHPQLLALATDPEIIAKVRQIDFAAALDHALQEPGAPPAGR